MVIAIGGKGGLTRRHLLVRSAAMIAVGGLAKPYLSRAADRPAIACGIQSGDVSASSAVIWARADRAARMRVEYSLADSFASILGSASAEALPDSDFTSKLLLEGLPAGQDIFYRVRFENRDDSGIDRWTRRRSRAGRQLGVREPQVSVAATRRDHRRAAC